VGETLTQKCRPEAAHRLATPGACQKEAKPLGAVSKPFALSAIKLIAHHSRRMNPGRKAQAKFGHR
jgi:hypothetical protein